MDLLLEGLMKAFGFFQVTRGLVSLSLHLGHRGHRLAMLGVPALSLVLPASQAAAVLAVVPRKSARLIAKTLKSALANAENNNGLKPETLWVKEAVAGTATTLKRMRPKARGSAGPILKRNCHIKIVLSDG